MQLWVTLIASLAFAAAPSGKKAADPPPARVAVRPPTKLDQLVKPEAPKPKVEHAIFAGGCFWCMQPPFDALKSRGVISTTVGYTGGTKENPTYEQVSHEATGHREAIDVAYDPAKIPYGELLEVFWLQVDPFDAQGQFCDKGDQYTSAIFYANEDQKRKAEEVLQRKEKMLGKSIVTKILPGKPFYSAEEYHQSYYTKNPIRYKFYRFNCGRDKRLKEVWGKSDH